MSIRTKLHFLLIVLPIFAGKEVYTSNFFAKDLELIIDFIEKNIELNNL